MISPLPRDFLETPEGLLFAVVAAGLEQDRALCFLRYRRLDGAWCKLTTEAANALLVGAYPQYLHYSVARDAHLHGVPLHGVSVHYQPRSRLAQLLRDGGRSAIEDKLCRLLNLLAAAGVDLSHVGVTGSLLIGAGRPDSDFDLVIYGRAAFFQVREAVMALLRSGRLSPLSDALWQDAFQRRHGALDFADFLRHERRKFNKAAFEGTKFDLTLTPETIEPVQHCRKLGRATITARVVDADRAFDHPACYGLDHPEVGEALSYTHTYAGQAWPGETVEIAGLLEQGEDQRLRIVVGSSREAPGEFIRVLWAEAGNAGG
ncbi:MAG: hypothetical protein EPN21_14920 [Methylococcaceae bacterium]|nr:MAG: hypothetical protein EPN21_14920 [Methylococcaceae bacterium]